MSTGVTSTGFRFLLNGSDFVGLDLNFVLKQENTWHIIILWQYFCSATSAGSLVPAVNILYTFNFFTEKYNKWKCKVYKTYPC